MSGALSDAVVTAVQKILEVSAFELADVVEAGPPPPGAITARLAFHGPHRGDDAGVDRARAEARAFASAASASTSPTPTRSTTRSASSPT
jgi:hypothetical protein